MTRKTTKPKPKKRQAGQADQALTRARAGYLRRWNEAARLTEALANELRKHRKAYEHAPNEFRIAEVEWVRQVLRSSLDLLRVEDMREGRS